MKVCVKFFLLLFFVANNYAQKSPESYNILQEKFEKTTFKKQYVFSEIEFKSTIFDDVENDSLFEFVDKKYINQGINNKSHWIKIKVINNSENEDFVLEFNQTNIDSLNLFVVKNNIIIDEFKTKGLHFTNNNKSSYLSVKYGYVYD